MRTNSYKSPAAILLAVVSCISMASYASVSPAAAQVPEDPIETSKMVTFGARPAAVPKDYVVTPVGYVHPSCIKQLSSTEILTDGDEGQVVVDMSKNAQAMRAAKAAVSTSMKPTPETAMNKFGAGHFLTKADHARGKAVDKCKYPRFDSKGVKTAESTTSQSSVVTPQNTTPGDPFQDGWIIANHSMMSQPMRYLSATWNVPPAPPVSAGQTIFFFPGFQDSRPVILQPVLAWFNGSWMMASWGCCQGGGVYHSEWVPVNGSTVRGTVSGNGCQDGICSTWTVDIQDYYGTHSTFQTATAPAPYYWTFGSVLEVYKVESCTHLPAGSVTFSQLYFMDTNYYRVYPSFVTEVHRPVCNYTGTVNSPYSHTLSWSWNS